MCLVKWSLVADPRMFESSCENIDGSPMTDCKREETWLLAKWRKAMNGFSESTLLPEGHEVDDGLCGCDERSDDDAMMYSTDCLISLQLGDER